MRTRTVFLTLALAAMWPLVTISAKAEPESSFDAAAAAAGRGLFKAYCASCHGASGSGDGTVAEWLKVKPADLTVLRQNNDGEFPLARIMKIVDGRGRVRGHGGGEMPVWGNAFQVSSGGHTEEEVQELIRTVVQYIWSIQK